jgi:hypothetical protein
LPIMASHSIKTVTFYTRLLWLPFGQHALYITRSVEGTKFD